MLEERINGSNQISGIRFSEKNNAIKSPYLLQLRNFEERLKNKNLKPKYESLFLKRPVDNQKICPNEVLDIAKNIVATGNSEMPFFSVDKENCFDADIDNEKASQGELILRVR